MGQILLFVLAILVVIALVILVWLFLVVGIMSITGSAAAGIVERVYHLVRGRRDQDEGIPCPSCGKRAFPIAGQVTRYRCASCHQRFDGPEHF